jgi:hypothetical protein
MEEYLAFLFERSATVILDPPYRFGLLSIGQNARKEAWREQRGSIATCSLELEADSMIYSLRVKSHQPDSYSPISTSRPTALCRHTLHVRKRIRV